MPIQLFKGRKERQQKQHLEALAKKDAETLHNNVDLDFYGELTDKHIEALAQKALKTHTFTDEEKAIFLPIFTAEVYKIELLYEGL